jgi:hypothetical protein
MLLCLVKAIFASLTLVLTDIFNLDQFSRLYIVSLANPDLFRFVSDLCILLAFGITHESDRVCCFIINGRLLSSCS